MLETIKKQRAGFYLNLVLVVLILVSTILFAINSALPLFTAVATINGGIYVCLILSLVFLLCSCILGIAPFAKEGGAAKAKDLFIGLLRIAACALLAVATVTFVGGRIENIGYYIGSDLYLGNEQAISAVTQSIAVIVFLAITWVLSLIAVFFAQDKQ